MKPAVPPFQQAGGFGTLGSSFVEPTLPDSVSLAPATWGAWLTLLLLGLAVAMSIAGIWRRRARRRHRRVAGRELEVLRQSWQSAPPAERAAVLERLPPLLKGCALGSFDRARVAPLFGRGWLDFLGSTGADAGWGGATGEALIVLCERGAAAVAQDAVPELFAAAARWIARHHV